MNTDFDLKTNASYLVAIEWDGKQPPSKWYRRLASFGLRVSGSKDLGPVERRATAFQHEGKIVKGVIYQEGTIMVSSYSLARTLAFYAKKQGARNVRIAALDVLDTIEQSQQDTQIMQRIENVFGRRGRPPAKHSWAVSCLECMSLGDQETAAVVNCHNCGGLRINSRKGHSVTYADPGGDVVMAWLRTRFAGPHWEPSDINPEGQEAPPIELCHHDDKDAWIAMEDSPVLDVIEKMDRASAFLFLDAIYVNLSAYSYEQRAEKRVRAAVHYYQLGGGGSISISEPEAPDLLVAAGPLASKYVATTVLALEGS